MESIISEEELWDSYNNLLLSADTSRIRKLIVRYELFKMTLDVPGDIVEVDIGMLGVLRNPIIAAPKL